MKSIAVRAFTKNLSSSEVINTPHIDGNPIQERIEENSDMYTDSDLDDGSFNGYEEEIEESYEEE